MKQGHGGGGLLFVAFSFATWLNKRSNLCNGSSYLLKINKAAKAEVSVCDCTRGPGACWFLFLSWLQRAISLINSWFVQCSLWVSYSRPFSTHSGTTRWRDGCRTKNTIGISLVQISSMPWWSEVMTLNMPQQKQAIFNAHPSFKVKSYLQSEDLSMPMAPDMKPCSLSLC